MAGLAQRLGGDVAGYDVLGPAAALSPREGGPELARVTGMSDASVLARRRRASAAPGPPRTASWSTATTRPCARPSAPRSGRRPAPTSAGSSGSSSTAARRSSRPIDAGGVDLAIFDGEAWPTGGLGLCKQLKDEVARLPAGARARRPPRRRVAGHLVARRRRRAAPDRRPGAAPPPRPSCCAAARRRCPSAAPSADRRRARRAPRRWAGPACSRACWPAGTSPAADTAWAMREVMAGEASPAQVAGFLVALRAKGETPDEVAGLVEVMLDEARRGRRARAGSSTPAAPAATAAAPSTSRRWPRWSSPAPGCRWPSTATGRPRRPAAPRTCSRQLGVVVDLPPAAVGPCLAEAGIAFCFAPVFHPGMRHAGPTRRELGVPTVFNVLGPLTNPARPLAQAVGVSDPRLAPVMAQVLAGRGADALVFRGDDGLDELTTTGPSTVWVVGGGAGARGAARPGRARHAASRPWTTCAAATPPSTRRSPATVLDGAAGRRPRRGAAQRRRGARGARRRRRAAARTGCAPACSGRRRPLDERRRRGGLLDRWVQVSQALRGRPGGLSALRGAARRPGVGRGARAGALGLDAQARTSPRGRAASTPGRRCGSASRARPRPC